MIPSTSIPSKKPLSIFTLVMMTVLAIDSIKNLPANAQYGSSLLFYYLIAILTFFIPSALVAAELSTGWPETGGVYIWTREAFGKRTAFLAAWMQWVYQAIWYPTILSFIAVTLTYFITPELATNKLYVLTSILIVFWLATWLNCAGINISSKISIVCTIIGVIVPMVFITLLGVIWISLGNESQLNFSYATLIPKSVSSDELRLFITLLFSLMGIEVVAIHAGDVNNPKRTYPRALIIATAIIIATVIPSSLAIAVVIPTKQIGLTTGVVESFTIFLSAFHLSLLKPLIVVSVAVGSFGIFSTWLLASARCLMIAAQDNCLPPILQKTNKKDMPVAILIAQGIVFTTLSSAFVLMPTVSSAFWILTASASQLALIYYLFLFSSALRLRYKKPDVIRSFQAGKSPIILWLLCLSAMTTCLVAIIFGFIPPDEIDAGHIVFYQLFLAGMILGSCVIAFILYEVNIMAKNLLA